MTRKIVAARRHLCLFRCRDLAQGGRQAGRPESRSESWDTAAELGVLRAAGAAAAIVQRHTKIPDGFPVLRVESSVQATLDLATAARARFAGKLLAVTGTVGKTTTREMLKHVLGFQGKTSGTTANFNTRLGVPCSVAQIPTDGDYAVIEVSVAALNARDDAIPLLVRPDIAIITAIGLAHTSLAKDAETMARFKARLFHGLTGRGTAVINRDMDMFPLVAQLATEYGAARIVTFGESPDADVRLRRADLAADHSVVTAEVFGEPANYEVPVAGKGMIMNSLACLAAVSAAGADWRRAAADLAFYRTKPGRMRSQSIPIAGGSWQLLDDSANATPISMKHGIEALGLARPGPGGRRIAVLGRIAEIGERALELHGELAPSCHWRRHRQGVHRP